MKLCLALIFVAFSFSLRGFAFPVLTGIATSIENDLVKPPLHSGFNPEDDSLHALHKRGRKAIAARLSEIHREGGLEVALRSGPDQIGAAETVAQQLFGVVDEATQDGEISEEDHIKLNRDAADRALDITDILGKEVIE